MTWKSEEFDFNVALSAISKIPGEDEPLTNCFKPPNLEGDLIGF